MLNRFKELLLIVFMIMSTTSYPAQFVNHTDSLYHSLKSLRITKSHKLDIYYQIINYHYLSNQYAEMKLAIDEAFKLLKGSADSCTHNKFLLMEAMHVSAKKDKSKAIALTDKILISSRTNNCSEVEISTLLFQAKQLLRSKDPDPFMNKIKLARQIAMGIKNDVLIARTYNMEGIWNLINNNLAESRNLMFLALPTFIEFNENALAGKAYSDIAYSFYLQSVYDSALIYNKIAVLILEKGTSYGDLVSNYNNMALVYQNTGKLNEAIETYFEGLKVADYLNSSADRTIILYNIGGCYYSLGMKDKALDNYNFCLNQAELNKDTFSILYACNAIGQMALENKEIDTANKYITKSFNLAQILDDTYSKMFNSLSMAALEREKDNFRSAQEYIDQSYVYAEQLNNPEDLMNIDMEQADLYAKQKQYNKSIALLQETYKKALIINSIESAQYIRISLAEVYEKAGDLKNALIYTKKVKNYQDSTNSVSILANLVSTESQYEKEKTERIKQLEFEKAELKRISDIKNTKLFGLLLIISIIALIITSWLLYKLSKSRKKRNKFLTEKNILIQTHSDDLKEMVNKLSLITKNLEVANKTKSKLLSIIGHDLRNPFNVIQGYISILIDSDLDPEKRKTYYNRINKASDQLLDMVDSLVTWSKTQTDKIQFNPVNTSITEISNQSILLLQNNANLKNIEIVYDYDRNQEAKIMGDPDMLKRIIHNLLVNAIKFTKNGGKIFIGFDLKDSDLTYWIKDTGIGMDPEVASAIFENSGEFVQNGTNGEKGTGLGLSICHEFIKYHRGKIWAKSELNKGTSFIFNIPSK
ncbi:MAG: hypothetical protein KKG99_06510 [Bacteroidetes bacterium]|nr:hypothetical protein [Bacteroidota bacterium]